MIKCVIKHTLDIVCAFGSNGLNTMPRDALNFINEEQKKGLCQFKSPKRINAIYPYLKQKLIPT